MPKLNESLKQTNKERDVLEAMGGENEKLGREAVEEYQKIIKSKVKEKKEQEESQAKKKLRFWEGYRRFLVQTFYERLKRIEMPYGIVLKVEETNKGIALRFMTPKGRIFAKGFTPCGQPEYDLNAIDVLSCQFENTLERLKHPNDETLGLPKLDASTPTP